MISGLRRGSRFRRSIPTTMQHLRRSRSPSGQQDRTGLPTRAPGIRVGNASRSSTQTAHQIPCRRVISTITGMASALTLSVMPDQGLFSASSICPPILTDRMRWAVGCPRKAPASGLKSAHEPSRSHAGLCPAKLGPCTAGYTVSPLAWRKSPKGRHHHPFHRHKRPARIRPV